MKRNGDFPKLPGECKRHRWLPIIDLKTGQPVGGEMCWHCGAKR